MSNAGALNFELLDCEKKKIMIKYMLLMKTIANSYLRHRRHCDKIDKLSVNLTQKEKPVRGPWIIHLIIPKNVYTLIRLV